jgi:type II secretory pathway component GspD/PulD (secretin)
MEIPVLGSLFGTTRKFDLNSELFLFLTPHIIDTDQDTDRVRQRIEKDNPRLWEVLPWGRREVR